MPEELKLGERMKLHRDAANLTQQQVADAMGQTVDSVSKYEHSRRFPIASMVSWMRAVGINPDSDVGKDLLLSLHKELDSGARA